MRDFCCCESRVGGDARGTSGDGFAVDFTGPGVTAQFLQIGGRGSHDTLGNRPIFTNPDPLFTLSSAQFISVMKYFIST